MSVFQNISINELRKNLYFYSLLLLLIGLPLSKALVSISEVLLVLSWLVAPGFRERLKLLSQRKSIWIFVFSMLIVFAGLFYSDNIQRDVFLITNIKISLILFPIIIGTSAELTRHQLKVMLVTFSAATFIATFVSSIILFNVIDYKIANVRHIAVFVESVRFGLIIVFNILFLLFAFVHTKKRSTQFLIFILAVWFLIFLGILQSLTGIVALALTLLVVFAVNYRKIKFYIRAAFVIVTLFFLGYFVFLFSSNLKAFNTIHVVDVNNLDSLTANDNKYCHFLDDTVRINGYLRGIYICEPELRNQWPTRSMKSLDSLDNAGWVTIKETLIKYLTSKGLRKDSIGLSQLSDRDIKNIESGYYNYRLAEVGINARIYDVIRETEEWRKTGLPAGSITIRINALHNGWKVYKRHPWIGTGYGDINDDIQAQFEEDNLVFGEDKRQNLHNQLFTILVGSGIVGLVIFLISFLLPGIIERKYKSYLFLVSFCVITISFFTDDTLERMIGAIMMALFFSLSLYAIPKFEDDKK